MFDTYWTFAAERQRIYRERVGGARPPWTSDTILSDFRFTNCYRAADRVSQYLIRNIAYGEHKEPAEIFFRTLLFRFFNRIDTWELLEQNLGPLRWSEYSFRHYDAVLDTAMSRGERVYSAAYVIPPPQLGESRKHANHLRLIECMMREHLPDRLTQASTMAAAFRMLREYPTIGDFIGYQLLIDLNYSPLLSFDEADFIVAGPGARSGLRKCFHDADDASEADLIRAVTEGQHEHFNRLGLAFQDLWGRDLQLIDCQNLFCEVDKYSRVAHPEARGIQSRKKIKQRFNAGGAVPTPWFPMKWGINSEVHASISAERGNS